MLMMIRVGIKGSRLTTTEKQYRNMLKLKENHLSSDDHVNTWLPVCSYTFPFHSSII